MKIYLRENVLDAARERIRFIFREFPNVLVSISGGKDSTVTLNLTLEIAEEEGRLPLPVVFLDQEAEWQTVIDYIREVMHDPRVKPYWLQVPLRILNATSQFEPWLHCWEPGAEWIRDKEPDSIHENRYGTDRFAELFGGFLKTEFPGEPAAFLAGVRAEESPTRFTALTTGRTYKHITYGKQFGSRPHYTFYPLYDWLTTDIWKAIHEHRWPYCPIYDYFYQRGLPVREMRVSNLHHETAVRSLYILQEIEPDTWNRVSARLAGINTAGQMKGDYFIPESLPPMFASWREYRDHLLRHLTTDDARPAFEKHFALLDKRYAGMHHIDELYQVEVSSILHNDLTFTRITNWERRPQVHAWRTWKAGRSHPAHATNRYIHG